MINNCLARQHNYGNDDNNESKDTKSKSDADLD